MSWHYSRALEAAYWEDICSGGALCAPSSETPTPSAYCSPDRMTDVSRLSRYGMTYAPSMDTRGEARLTWFLAGFPARTSPLQGAEPDSQASGRDSGAKWHESFAKYDPNSHLWRTPQRSLFAGSTPFSGTWPKWGTMRRGECWEQTMPERHIEENEFGLSQVPTPTVRGNYNRKGASPNSGDGLATWAKMWPTPNASDVQRGSQDPEKRKQGGHQVKLSDAVKAKMWPTPTASEYKHTDCTSERNRRTPSLSAQVNTGPNVTVNRDAVLNLCLSFPQLVFDPSTPAVWATPTVQDSANNAGPSQMTRNSLPLNAQVGGALNPTWVEWLMGWPLGWTALDVSETVRFQQWQRSHGLCYDDDWRDDE
jgi:hypothetical protein